MARGAVRAGRILALVLAVAVAALGLLLLPSPTSTSAAPTQDCSTTTLLERCPTTTGEGSAQEETTTLDPVTSANLLIPGDGTEGAESTTTTVLSATSASDGGLGDGTLIALVIVGLVLIAGVVAVLTWRYWVGTRPPLRDTDTASARAG